MPRLMFAKNASTPSTASVIVRLTSPTNVVRSSTAVVIASYHVPDAVEHVRDGGRDQLERADGELHRRHEWRQHDIHEVAHVRDER